MTMRPAFLSLALFLVPFASAQTSPSPDDVVTSASTSSPADIANEAWTQLTDSLNAKNTDTRLAALNALSLLGGNPKAEGMVRSTLADANIDVRLAAIVAAGQMDKDRGQHGAFHKDLHDLLASDDPKISFTAATTLWALHDTAGQDVLSATAEGERASDYSFWKRSQHNASRTLHSPEALARIAVQQGLVILVPPVGMGMGAYSYLKGAPEASPQVTAIVQLAKVHTPSVQHALIEATKTKSAGARTAAAESLATFPGPLVRDALYALFTDDKSQVRLTATAAYLANVGGKSTPSHGTVSH